jgi:gas vesicle protein
MLKAPLVAAFIAVTALSAAPAASQDLCTDAHMKQMDEMIAKMTDAAKQKEATMHLDMSKAEMKKGNTAECMKHMEEAHKAMGL